MTKDRTAWKTSIPDVADALEHPSAKIEAKALWLLGEMGLEHPPEVAPYLRAVARFLRDDDPLLRERALHALGRIGRGDCELVRPVLEDILACACDDSPEVRMNFIWACENIATNAPDLFVDRMPVFAALLDDDAVRVRMEAPEMFRVMGKRRREAVEPYLAKLETLAETDGDRVVRIHAAGAIKAACSAK